MVATTARRIGDLDIAEEMAAEAFAIAVERWPIDGVPPNPGAWLTTTAHRKAIDRLRREVIAARNLNRAADRGAVVGKALNKQGGAVLIKEGGVCFGG